MFSRVLLEEGFVLTFQSLLLSLPSLDLFLFGDFFPLLGVVTFKSTFLGDLGFSAVPVLNLPLELLVGEYFIGD